MLYVFQVDTGQMLNFEMDVAISTVQTLKSKILSVQGIPLDKQVLLVSGGEILEGSSRVCNYAAGTDTNPIFLFNKLNIEGGVSTDQSMQQTSSGGDGANNLNLADLETIHKQITDASTLPSTYMSVVTRTQLAQHVYDMGKEITRKCEILIHHQHLQHQGWAAVVANLDDIVGVFNSKMAAFSSSYDGFFGEFSKEDIDSFVDGLDTTLKTLDQIKLPRYYEDIQSENQQQSSSTPEQQQSIVQWLSEHFSAPSPVTSSSSCTLHAHLNSVATSTRKTHDHLSSPNFLQNLQQDASNVIEKASSPNMKEIKGLEERLYGLDQLLQEAKKIVLDQHELTQAFHQNVSRASDLRDSSIFPDLCNSHQHQLLVMYKNHSQLEDIRRRCGRAKEELTFNLNTRLKWIAFVQKSLSETGGKISVYHESLKRLRVHVSQLQQISECERVFNGYVEEVKLRAKVGRKLHGLVGRVIQFNSVAEGETRRRAEFREAFGGHFLSQAFSVLVEDRGIGSLVVPKLVSYVTDGDEEMDEDGDDLLGGSGSSELVGKVKELEGVVENLKASNGSLEDRIRSLEGQLEMENKKANNLRMQLTDSRLKSRLEGEKAEKLAAQVEDLRKLIDEFRVKEEEVIRVHGEEVEAYERKVRGLEEGCEERARELTRMLEFEWGQKVKAVEEAHKMEYDAMVARFKLVNKSVFGGSNERIGPVSPSGGNPMRRLDTILSSTPVVPGQQQQHLQQVLVNVNSGKKKGRGRSVMIGPQHLLFSDEEEEEEDEDTKFEFEEDIGGGGNEMMDTGSARNKVVNIKQEQVMMQEDPDDYCRGGGQDGSLERAVDAAVAFFGVEVEEEGNLEGGEMKSGSEVVVVPERVITTAQRLQKLSRISVSTCRVGSSEPNLFYWNDKFNAFTVYLTNRNVHFLNTSERGTSGPSSSCSGSEDSHNVIRSLSKSQKFIACVADKEFCVARRANNRYNVPQGFHFYRVKCGSKVEVVEE